MLQNSSRITFLSLHSSKCPFRTPEALTLFTMKFLSLGLLAISIVANFGASASPVNATAFDHLLDHDAREILKRATPAAPHFVVYADAWDGSTGPPAASALKVRKFPQVFSRL